jgi:hypothetical protein
VRSFFFIIKKRTEVDVWILSEPFGNFVKMPTANKILETQRKSDIPLDHIFKDINDSIEA